MLITLCINLMLRELLSSELATMSASTPLIGRRQRAQHPIPRIYIAIASAALLVVIGLFAFSPSSTQLRDSTPTTATSDFPGARDLITTLHGMPPAYTSRLFSGYLPLENGGEGFYFFAESQSPTPEQDPVLLWLNGGPGASSLSGCFTENGPLIINADGETLSVNEFAWNLNANFVCIESPVGVGFTYNASLIYKSDDEAQADELYWMLQQFFTKFPWLRSNDFIISGESYGGVYVPMTAKRIVEGNQKALAANRSELLINLKRFAVGNGINEFSSLSTVNFAYFHGLISTDAFTTVAKSCPQLMDPAKLTTTTPDSACNDALSQFQGDLSQLEVNHYNIYAPCNGHVMDGADRLVKELHAPLLAVPRPMSLPLVVCLNWTREHVYFNIPSVRLDLHTKNEIERWNGNAYVSTHEDLKEMLPNMTDMEVDQVLHNKVLEYHSTRELIVTPLWRFLVDSGVEGVIYHGDTDMACDFIGGLWAVESLGLPRQAKRRVWNVPGDGQTAGFLEEFGAIKYVTVRGSGHMVPQDKPREAKAMLDEFILPGRL